jgi:alpha-tubulin suppressor-like RCC1 family protein
MLVKRGGRLARTGVAAAAVAVAAVSVAASLTGAPRAGAIGAQAPLDAVVTGNGAAFGWGANASGQTGTGVHLAIVPVPTAVSGLSGRVRQVASNRTTGAALMNDGTVQTWGSGTALGDGTFARPTPAPVPGLTGITQLASGGHSVLAIGVGGSVLAWGDDTFGQLGDGDIGSSRPFPFQIPGLSGIIQIAVSREMGMALRSDGVVFTWGTGFLGDGTFVTQPRLPAPVPHLTGVMQIAVGGQHAMVVRSDKTLWTWGENGDGELGLGNVVDQTVPVQVPGLANVTSIAAGALFSLAVADPSASVWSWGANYVPGPPADVPMGQLGDGTQVHSRNTPGRLSLTGITQVSAGWDSLAPSGAAIDQAGVLRTWGSNQTSELGINSTDLNRFSPVQVAGIPPVQQISINSVAMAVVSNVTVRSPGAQSAAVGTPITPLTLSATPAAAYTWSAAGLPPGLTLNTATGTISGTPTTAGSFGVSITATSANGSGRAGFTFTVTGASACAEPGQKLRNPGFESGPTSWTATTGVIGQNGPAQPAHAGTFNAWLDGDGTAHTDTVTQSVTIPARCTSSTLTFSLHIDTAETATTAVDTLTVKLGTSTVATFSNLNKGTGYTQRTISIGGTFAGQTLPLTFTGTENAARQTSFVIDDVTFTAG